jgi:hypothetical protein
LGTLTSCITTIKSINKKPERYQGKKVFVRGEVISSLDLLDINCFTLKGRKSNLLIITDNLLPLKRDKIWVTGVVERNYKYKSELCWLLLKRRRSLESNISRRTLS